MNCLLKITILCLLLAGAMAFFFEPNSLYMSNRASRFSMSCARRTWNRSVIIRFYGNNRLLFDSTNKGLMTGVATTSGNRTVTLPSSSFTGGITNLYCTINGVASQNTVLIPYFEEPYLTHPPTWRANQTHVLGCSGYISPRVPLTTEFYFENRLAARIENGFISPGGLAGLVINPYSNNSMTVKPSMNNINGTFYCRFTFNIAGTNLKSFQSSNRWRTNGSGNLSSQTLLIITSVLAALLASYRS